MLSSSRDERLPDGLRAIRRLARGAILAGVWLLPPVLAGLAERGGMGWELVAGLGVAVAVVSSGGCRASVPAARECLGLAGGAAIGCALVLGAGHAVLPAPLARALPFLALALAGGLCDGRALGLAFGVLALQCLMPLGAAADIPPLLTQGAGLAVAALAMLLAQRLARRAARRRPVVLGPPATGRGGPSWTAPGRFGGPAGLLVQAERTAEGTLRLAVAGARAGQVRVTVT